MSEVGSCSPRMGLQRIPTAEVSVIIPTIASKGRAFVLKRAIDSLRAQSFGRAVPIVVANGPHRDRNVIADLKRQSDVRLLEQEEGSLPKALATGRSVVDTEFFGTLDDDDEYLPNALGVRLPPFEKSAAIAVVATNGYESAGKIDTLALPEIEACRSNPLDALMEVNWLASCGGLYRTSLVGARMFAAMPKYLEWTYLAALLASQHEISFVDTPTYRKYSDTVGALSRSRAYTIQAPRALRTIYNLDLPYDIKKKLQKKYINALHSASDLELKNRNYASAWKFHVMTLINLHGVRYISYTRHLIHATKARRS